MEVIGTKLAIPIGHHRKYYIKFCSTCECTARLSCNDPETIRSIFVVVSILRALEGVPSGT